jgi:hypothetical protein
MTHRAYSRDEVRHASGGGTSGYGGVTPNRTISEWCCIPGRPERASTGPTIRSDRPLRHYADGQVETHAGDAAIEIVADFPAIPDWVEPGWVSAGWVDHGQAGYQVMLRELDQMNRASH